MADKKLRLVIVTPERTLLDASVDSLRFPLYDGDVGVLPGRLPMIGRLGAGELKLTIGGEDQAYFIDGGFVQIRNSVATILTNAAVPTRQLTVEAAETELAAAHAKPGISDDQYKAKDAAEQRARRKLSIARRPR